MNLYSAWNSSNSISFWIASSKNDLFIKVWDAPVTINNNVAVIDLFGNDEIDITVRNRETGRVVASAQCIYNESTEVVELRDGARGFTSIELPH